MELRYKLLILPFFLILTFSLTFDTVKSQTCGGSNTFTTNNYKKCTPSGLGWTCTSTSDSLTVGCGWHGGQCNTTTFEPGPNCVISGGSCTDGGWVVTGGIMTSGCGVGLPTPTPGGAPDPSTNVSCDHLGASGTTTDCRAYGWAKDPNSLNNPRPVQVWQDGGGLLVSGTANNMTYGDGGTPGCGAANDPCGFSLSLAGVIPYNTLVGIRVKTVDANTGEWVTCSNSPKAITCVPPNVAPTCSVTGPATGSVGSTYGFTISGNDGNGNMDQLEGWRSPTSTQTWTNILNSTFTPRSTFSATANFTCDSAGNYYVVCNAYDSAGASCTGNPWTIPPGWTDCGAAATKTISCVTPTPPPPPPPPGGCNVWIDAPKNQTVIVGQTATYRWSSDDYAGISNCSWSHSPIRGTTNVNPLTRQYSINTSSTGSSTVSVSCTASGGGPNCTDNGTLTVNPSVVGPCSCTANLSPPSWSGNVGSVVGFWTDVNNYSAGCSVSNVSYSSSNNGVMTMNPANDPTAPYVSNGTAVAPGNATISSVATLNDGNTCSDSSAVSVQQPVSVSCNLSASPNSGTEPVTSTLTGSVGGTATGDIRYRFDCTGDGTYEHDFTTSGNPQSRPCTYTAGNYTARLRVDRQGVSNTCSANLNIAAAPVCNINVSASPGTIDISKTSAITANASANYPIDRVEFVSSNTGAVTVSPSSDSTASYNTTATGVDVGSSTITARCIVNGVNLSQATTTVTVRPPSCAVNLSPANPLDSGITKTTAFSAFVSNTNGLPVQRVDFSSSNTSVATVSPASDSTVAYTTTATGVGPGDTTIRAGAFIFGYECGTDTSPLKIQSPTCSVRVDPANYELEIGASQNFAASILSVGPAGIYTNSDISGVNFAITPGTAATISPNSDNSSPYQTVATGTAVSTTDELLRADVMMYGASRCNDEATITVINPPPWWQVKEGDVVAATGDIASDIPFACVDSLTCEEAFMIHDTDDYPGVPSHTGGIFTGTDGGYISSTGWEAESGYLGQTTYDYSYFENKLSVTPEPISVSVSGSTFNTDGAVYPPPPASGYAIYRANGNLTISDAVNIVGGRKVILFVNGSLNINGPINVEDGRSLFMVIASGDIHIGAGIGTTPAPHIEGIYYTDGQFITDRLDTVNDLDIPLVIRGLVIANSIDGVQLKRDLDPNLAVNNTNTPAETIEYAPDQVLMYPTFLGEKSIQWREVAP